MDKQEFLGTSFWVEVNKGLFVHNEQWGKTLQTLPNLLSLDHTTFMQPSIDQLIHSGMEGRGCIGTELITNNLNWDAVEASGINSYSPETLFLQWCYLYHVIEGVSRTYPITPLFEWPDGFLRVTEAYLHAMTYIAALLLLHEEGINPESIQETEVPVRTKAMEVISLLHSKCSEYGESFRRHGVQGMLPRLWDKAARYAQLSALGKATTYEPKVDSIKDLLGYMLIAWSLIRELHEKEE